MTNKLYIPEIGDQIILSHDWTFTLCAESRNEMLGETFNHFLFTYQGFRWIDKSKLSPMRKVDYVLERPNVNDSKFKIGMLRRFDNIGYNAACQAAAAANPEYVKYMEDLEQWRKSGEKVCIDEIEVTLPKGTQLQIDRIYIRKGKEDYSSISFYAKNLSEVMPNNSVTKDKAIRFFAGLIDCNNIVFEFPK